MNIRIKTTGSSKDRNNKKRNFHLVMIVNINEKALKINI